MSAKNLKLIIQNEVISSEHETNECFFLENMFYSFAPSEYTDEFFVNSIFDFARQLSLTNNKRKIILFSLKYNKNQLNNILDSKNLSANFENIELITNINYTNQLMKQLGELRNYGELQNNILIFTGLECLKECNESGECELPKYMDLYSLLSDLAMFLDFTCIVSTPPKFLPELRVDVMYAMSHKIIQCKNLIIGNKYNYRFKPQKKGQ